MFSAPKLQSPNSTRMLLSCLNKSKRKPNTNEEEKKSNQNLRINNINSVIGNGLLNLIEEEASESDDPLSSQQILA